MGKPKQIKSKEDRLKEGISLLKQMREGGVREKSLGYIQLQGEISKWVNSEDSWEGTIYFPEYGRVALVELPKYDNRAAGIDFKVRQNYS